MGDSLERGLTVWADAKRHRIDNELSEYRCAEWREYVRFGGELVIHFDEHHWLNVKRERTARLLGEPRKAAA